MSTILQALLKNKFEQAGGASPVMHQADIATHWKVSISLATVIIIGLLSTLVYLLINPRTELKVSPIVEVAQPKVKPSPITVIFETQPMPISIPAPKMKVLEETATPQRIVSAERNTTPDRPLPEDIMEQKIEPEKVIPAQVTQEKSVPSDNEKSNQELNYDETSNDLKKRFEMALLLTEIEQNENPLEDFSTQPVDDDGRDIYDMSSDFQDKVPMISYDSHVYSSLVHERWIRINGETLKEGDFDSTGELELLEVQPQRSIFRVNRQSFSLESLTDWKGY